MMIFYIIDVLLILVSCPIIVAAFFGCGILMKKLFFHKEVDLSDVVFSKDRIEQLEKSNADEESNFVSIREAVAVSDYRNQRQLMMNILKRDTKKTLGSLSYALNSEDSETSHYAASALGDELGIFRNKVHKLHKIVREYGEAGKDACELIEMIYSTVKQDVFPPTEYKQLVEIADDTLDIMQEKYQEFLQPEYYEWVVELLLDISEYDKAFKWCGRVRSRYKEELITYKCYFRYYYGIGDGEMFLSTLEELKKVDVTIDSDTLELFRTFS